MPHGVQTTLSADDLHGWLRSTASLAESFAAESILQQIDVYRAQRSQPSFRVVVAGEFKRGKSTLLNRILDRPLLPTGLAPQTRSAVVVQSGDDERLVVEWPDGRREERPLNSDAFAGLTVLDSGVYDASVVTPTGGLDPAITAVVNNSWLASLEAELVDTPGSNEGDTAHDQPMRRAIAASDMVILAVSASSPLSLTEQRLLNEEVLRRHIPHLVVVVTMLDLVDVSDQGAVLDAIAARLRAFGPDVTMLPGPGPVVAPERVDNIRSAITKMAQQDGRAEWRNRRLVLQLADTCDRMANIAAEAAATAHLDDEARTKAYREATEQVGRDAGEWEQLRIDFESRRADRRESLAKAVAEQSSELTHVLTSELDRADDPKTWWDRELPERLHRELQATTRVFDSLVSSGVGEDTAWLEDHAAAQFAPVRRIKQPGTVHLQATGRPQRSELTDIKRRRRMNRLAAPIGTVVGTIIATALRASTPVVWSAGLAEIGTHLQGRKLNEATREQRLQVRRMLEQTIDDSIQRFREQIDRELDRIYSTVLMELRTEKDAWCKARVLSLSPQAPATEDPDWDGVNARATHLAETIRSHLAGLAVESSRAAANDNDKEARE